MLKKHRNPLLAVKTSVPTPRTVPEDHSYRNSRRCEAEEMREQMSIVNELDPNDQIRRELRTIREVLERLLITVDVLAEKIMRKEKES